MWEVKIQHSNTFFFITKPSDNPEDPERFWLGIVGEDGFDPKTLKFVIEWLSTYKLGDPNFQHVSVTL